MATEEKEENLHRRWWGHPEGNLSCWHAQLKQGRKEVAFPKPMCWSHLLNPDHSAHAWRKLMPRRVGGCSGHFTQKKGGRRNTCFSLPPTTISHQELPLTTPRWRSADMGAGRCRPCLMPHRIKQGEGMGHHQGQADLGQEHYFI